MTLPSDSSSKFFPGNKISYYITQLPNPISLTGEWEVGLSEVIYNHSWYNINEKNNDFIYDVGDGRKVRKELSPGSYETTIDILRAITLAVPPSKFNFSFNAHTKRVKVQVVKGASIQFGVGLSNLLGFNNEILLGTVQSPNIADPCSELTYFYIYADIVSPQVVGDIQAPLLRIVKVEGRNGEVISHNYDRPHYVPIVRNNFQTIEIQSRLNSGDLVPFERGKLIVVLHFRMRQIV